MAKRNRDGVLRWYAAMEGVRGCASCGGRIGLVLHHIVYRQHVRRASGDEWDPRNALALCDPCHASHHSRQRVLPATLLPREALAFASELLGEAAENYLARYYEAGETHEHRRVA